MNRMPRKILLKTVLILIIAISYANSDTNSTEEDLSTPVDYRLPVDVVVEPLHYDIGLTVNFTQDDANFVGKSTVLVNIKHRTTNIYLHAYELLVNEEATHLCSYGDPKRTYRPIKHNLNNDTQILDLEFDEEMSPGPCHLNMSFRGNITNNTIGFFRITYEDPSGQIK